MQEAARLMAAGDYEAALPVAVEAVTLGEQLFKPQPALQLFPLYLLAAQVSRTCCCGSISQIVLVCGPAIISAGVWLTGCEWCHH